MSEIECDKAALVRLDDKASEGGSTSGPLHTISSPKRSGLTAITAKLSFVCSA